MLWHQSPPPLPPSILGELAIYPRRQSPFRNVHRKLLDVDVRVCKLQVILHWGIRASCRRIFFTLRCQACHFSPYSFTVLCKAFVCRKSRNSQCIHRLHILDKHQLLSSNEHRTPFFLLLHLLENEAGNWMALSLHTNDGKNPSLMGVLCVSDIFQ